MRKARVFGQLLGVQGMVIEESPSRSIRKVTTRFWRCRCARTSGLPGGVVSAGGRARGTTLAWGPGGGAGGHRHHSHVPAGLGAAGAVPGAQGGGHPRAVGQTRREIATTSVAEPTARVALARRKSIPAKAFGLPVRAMPKSYHLFNA